MGTRSIVWFRLDLRLDDNPALMAAVCKGLVIPVFIWAPDEEAPWPPGAASRWWLHQSLAALQASLAALGSRLILRRGPTFETLRELISETGATSVFWNRRYEPAVIARDTQVKKALTEQGIAAESFNSALLFEPWTIRPYQVFTAFWKTCLKQTPPADPVGAPSSLHSPDSWPPSVALDELELEPKIDWAAAFHDVWKPGEAGAKARLESATFTNYATARDFPGTEGTSRLSPHLHFGEVSPRRVWQAAQSRETFRRELGWREFAYHLLYHFPQSTNQPLRPDFAAFPWREDHSLLKAWQRGVTGYPIVDAGMHELWTTGWMHNRVRMVVASFLTKQLRINWEEGAYWFWDTLVDADLASNTFGWQWSAGCGADAAPYFRIFNPERQRERFDPDGDYVRRWAPDAVPPVVELTQARNEALAAFEQMKKLRLRV